MNDSRNDPGTVAVTLKDFSTAALRSAAEEFEERSKRDPHLSLFRLHQGLLAAPQSNSELEHLGRCDFCKSRREKLLPLVAEDELRRRVGAGAAEVFVGHGWIRNWLDRFPDKTQATIESLWEFVSAPLAGPSTSGGEREGFSQKFIQRPFEIEVLETESGHIGTVIKTDEHALDGIQVRLILETSRGRADRVLQLRKGAAYAGPSASVHFSESGYLASELGRVKGPEGSSAGFLLRAVLENVDERADETVPVESSSNVVDISSWMKYRVRSVWDVDRLQLAAAGSTARGSTPQRLQIVPDAWKQSVDPCDQVSVWTARHENGVYLRLVPESGSALPESLRLMRVDQNGERKGLALEYPLHAVSDPLRVFLLPELISPGTWYLVGSVTDELIGLVLACSGWLVVPGENRREYTLRQTPAAADEICFEAIERAESGLWTSFLTALNRVTGEPNPALRILVRYYLAQLLTADALASARESYRGDPVLLHLASSAWIGDELARTIRRDSDA